MTETLEGWKEHRDLSDEEILTLEYRTRVSNQPPAQGYEIIYCACGCGESWLRSRGQEGRHRRHVRGHAPKKKPPKTRAELIARSIAMSKYSQENGTTYGFYEFYEKKEAS